MYVILYDMKFVSLKLFRKIGFLSSGSFFFIKLPFFYIYSSILPFFRFFFLDVLFSKKKLGVSNLAMSQQNVPILPVTTWTTSWIMTTGSTQLTLCTNLKKLCLNVYHLQIFKISLSKQWILLINSHMSTSLQIINLLKYLRPRILSIFDFLIFLLIWKW